MSEIYLYILVRERDKKIQACSPAVIRFPEKQLNLVISGRWEGRTGDINAILNDNENSQEIQRLLSETEGMNCEADTRLIYQIDPDDGPKIHNLHPFTLYDQRKQNTYIMSAIRLRLTDAKITEISLEQKRYNHQNIQYQTLAPPPRSLYQQINILEELSDPILEEIKIQDAVEKDTKMEKPPEQDSPEKPAEEQSPVQSEANSSNAESEIAISESQLDIKRKQVQRTLPQIIVRESALECAKKHALEQQDMETGGVLLGRFHPKGDSTIVVVTGIVRGLHTTRRVASLTFTPETWAQVLNWMDNDSIYSDDTTWSMVGWYHTHPSFGIFLSSYDLSIHKNHFQRPEHIALVIDPRRKEEGFFCWNLPMTDVARHKYDIKNDKEIQEILGIAELPVPEVSEPIKKEQKD